MARWKEELILRQRYQYQPWYIKLWRRRWYLMIPWWTLRRWGHKWSDGEVVTFRIALSIATGTAQHEMQWWWTWDELDERIRKKLS